jgi:hypothetical protein
MIRLCYLGIRMIWKLLYRPKPDFLSLPLEKRLILLNIHSQERY